MPLTLPPEKPLLPKALRQKTLDVHNSDAFLTDREQVQAYFDHYKQACAGSFNWESPLRHDDPAEVMRRMAYATAGEEFIATHWHAPVIATHTDQTRYYNEFRGNQRWTGIINGALKVEMLHNGAKVMGLTPYTVIGCDIPLSAQSAVLHVGLANAIKNGWQVVLTSLPAWRGERRRDDILLNTLKTIVSAGFPADCVDAILPHPADTPGGES